MTPTRPGDLRPSAWIILVLGWLLPPVLVHIAWSPLVMLAYIGGLLLLIVASAVSLRVASRLGVRPVLLLSLALLAIHLGFTLWARSEGRKWPWINFVQFGFAPFSFLTRLVSRRNVPNWYFVVVHGAALAQLAIWIFSILPRSSERQAGRLDLVGFYQAAVFGVALLAHALTTAVMPLPLGQVGIALGAVAFVMAFLGFFAVKRRRVPSMFQDDDPGSVRWAGYALIAYLAGNFLWAFISQVISPDVVKRDDGVRLPRQREARARRRIAP